MTLRKPAVLLSSDTETPNVVDLLDQSFLGLGGSLPEDRGRAGFRNVVFV